MLVELPEGQTILDPIYKVERKDSETSTDCLSSLPAPYGCMNEAPMLSELTANIRLTP
jgi:hypothetical protein